MDTSPHQRLTEARTESCLHSWLSDSKNKADTLIRASMALSEYGEECGLYVGSLLAKDTKPKVTAS